ncbi:MAG: 50S ribosomal protein L11 [Candidatus ainarchaeum sp.]|nr:50S ribosomal protein L11 [Candidatus ainarchaeum sp.]
MEKIISAIIDGGKATAGPPLGPALGPMGINAAQVVAKINEKTKAFTGMKVPVKVIVNTENKTFEIEVGAPATSELIKKEAGIEKGRKTKEETPGDISLEKLVDIAKKKSDGTLGKSVKQKVKEVLGSCTSLGITVNGKNPKEIIKEVNEGKHNSLLG